MGAGMCVARWARHGSRSCTKADRARAAPFAAFQYGAAHSVLEVSAADHGACSASNPLRSHRDQSTTIPLTKPGTRYFICGAAGHCAAGMKLAVTVSGGDAGPTMRSKNATPAAASTGAATESDSSASGAAAASGARLAIGLLLGAVGLAAALMG